MSNSEQEQLAKAEEEARWKAMTPVQKHQERCVDQAVDDLLKGIRIASRSATPQEVIELMRSAHHALTLKYRATAELLDNEGVHVSEKSDNPIEMLKDNDDGENQNRPE